MCAAQVRSVGRPTLPSPQLRSAAPANSWERPYQRARLLNAVTGDTRIVNRSLQQFLGFFHAVWSPNGRRFAFLSIDRNAVVRLWTWALNDKESFEVSGIDVRIGFGDRPVAWINDDEIAVVAWVAGANRAGKLEYQILRGRNAA